MDALLALATTDASALDAASREPLDLDEIVLSEARRLRSRTPHHVDTTRVSGAQLKGKSDQLHFQTGAADMILNHHAIMRFGTGHDTFYFFNCLTARILLSHFMHAKVSSRAYRARSISS